MQWLHDNRILICTNESYQQGMRTRQYRVNIALLLFLCGFQAEELDWSKVDGRSGADSQAGDMHPEQAVIGAEGDFAQRIS